LGIVEGAVLALLALLAACTVSGAAKCFEGPAVSSSKRQTISVQPIFDLTQSQELQNEIWNKSLAAANAPTIRQPQICFC
jgi:hypothetical protein